MDHPRGPRVGCGLSGLVQPRRRPGPRPGPRPRRRNRHRHHLLRRQLQATYEPTGDPFTTDPGDLAHFLTERYRYYTKAPDALRYADIDHPPWTLYDATPTLAADAVFTANGLAPPSTDSITYYSPGTDTVATGSHRLP
ncbi:MAG: DUF2071 domain-containing protein [Halobacteriaceae archaeon]